MSSIDVLKAFINSTGGVSQPCHYIVTIEPPSKMQTSDSGLPTPLGFLLGPVQRHLSLMCEQATIPGRQLLTTEHKIFGTLRKMPYGLQYEDFTATFICTNMFVERAFFDIWHQFIIGSKGQYMEYYRDYVGQIVVQKISDDPDSYSLATYTLEEAYPVSIQAQQIGYAETDYMRLTVQFAYSKWKSQIEKITEAVLPGGGASNVENPFTRGGFGNIG